MRKNLLSIAGFDPTSGAGVSLDVKVFQLLGFRGMSILTSLTAQNTQGVRRVHCLSPEFIQEQYNVLAEDVTFSGIKVGMLGCAKTIQAIRDILTGHQDIPKVIDPVFKSSSGTWLLEREAIPSYLSEIKGKITLLTPNLEEASLLSGFKIKNEEDMKKAAESIYSQSLIPCLIKGGHFSEKMVNQLYDGKRFHLFEKEKLIKKVHGTGCFFSSALLAYLCKGNSLAKACFFATELTHGLIKKAIRVGRGQLLFSL